MVRTRSISFAVGTFSGAPMAWITPIARPMKVTGTQSAEISSGPRSLRWGQASRVALEGKLTADPLRTATHANGDATGQPGPSG